MNRRTNLILSIFITLLILSGTVGVYAQSFPKKALASVSEERARNIVGFLADDLLEGRDAGMQGGYIAAEYIVSLFKEWGVEPFLESGYFQPFTAVKNVNNCLNDYEPTKAGRLIQDFVIDNVSNWFVRLSRKRFWGTGMSTDKLSAYQTLYTCLETVARLMAPIAPFYADRLYQDLTSVTGRGDATSVHLAKFPECDEQSVDSELEYRMVLAQQISSMVLALRKKEALIVRQPLQKIAIPAADEVMKSRIEAVKQLILGEVNVKELVFVEGDGILVKKIKCNFRTLGKKFGKLMKSVNEAVTNMSQEQIAELEKNGNITLQVEGVDALIELSDVEIFSEDVPGWTVANEGALTVALDVEVTDDLRREGIAREIVKKIQAMRKDSGFDIVDRIAVEIASNGVTDAAVEQFNAYICNQVLADELKISDNVEGDNVVELDNVAVKLSVRKL